MSNLIDKSFFVRDINIPNTNDQKILERLNMFIRKYEPICLEKLLGYSLYKALLIEAIGVSGRIYLGMEIRNDEQITVGRTVGLVAGASSFTFDGTAGKPDYRGYDIVPSELTGRGILIKNVDYSWDYITAQFNLLQLGDVFQFDTYYNIHFENHPVILDQTSNVVITNRMTDLLFGKEYTNSYENLTLWRGIIHDNISLIAYYVFYFFQEDGATQSTGVNTSIPKAEAAQTVSPAQKMITAWNALSVEVSSCLLFLLNNPDIYPEFTYNNYTSAIRSFGKISEFAF